MLLAVYTTVRVQIADNAVVLKHQTRVGVIIVSIVDSLPVLCWVVTYHSKPESY
jgi:hypothetical protein